MIYVFLAKGFEEIEKDNPAEYYKAFAQMVYALKYLRGEVETFEIDVYDHDSTDRYKELIMKILESQPADTAGYWKQFGEKLSGQTIEDFDEHRYEEEFMSGVKGERTDTFLGKFFLAAMNHKSMVTSRIFRSGNRLAGVSIDYEAKGFKGIRDFRHLIEEQRKQSREA